jgi:hypothetical protein
MEVYFVMRKEKKNTFHGVEPDTVIHSTVQRDNRLSFAFIFGWSCRVEIVLPASRTMKMDAEGYSKRSQVS